MATNLQLSTEAMIVCTLQVYYLVTSNERYEHERYNGSYTPLAYFFAELSITMVSLLVGTHVSFGQWYDIVPDSKSERER
jgi:hypothetical protein